MPAPKLERHVERTVVTWARNHGLFHTKMNGEGHSGMPDRIFWVPGGKPVLIEFKRPGAKPRPLQRYHIEKLKQIGYQVILVERADEAIAYLEKLLSAQQREYYG